MPDGAGERGIVLASASASRRDMLRNAGIDCRTIPSDVDESAIKTAMYAEGASVKEVAAALAEAKALAVAKEVSDEWVIGADQILELDGESFDKPADRDQARQALRRFSGKTHRLITEAVVAVDDRIVWRGSDSAELHMRPLSDAFIDGYLDAIGDDALRSVGSYQLEGRGAQLFDRVEGDFFVVLGLPLLPLLAFFREQGVIGS